MKIPTDPESEGIPDIADDNSTAYDDFARPKSDDTPFALPADEAVAVDDYGVTAYESSHDEPLNARLLREQKDVSPDDPQTPADPVIAGEAESGEAWAQAARDSDFFGDNETSEDLDTPSRREIGRLTAPDEGIGGDEEGQSIASDSGEREGLTSEEAAMHEIPGDEVPYN